MSHPSPPRAGFARARRLGSALALALALGLALPATTAAAGRQKASGPVHYRLSIPKPTTRYVHVQVTVPTSRSKTTQLAMPAWAPGSYLIRDFGKHVYDVEARALASEDAAGAALAVERVDKQTWAIANDGQGFTVDYRVFADDLSVRTSYVDDRYALLSGPSVFMYLVGETDRATTLEVTPPPGWPVHTALDPLAAKFSYTAPSYDELADSPLLLGEAQRRSFEVAGKALELVYLAPAGSNAKVDRVARDAEQIVRAFARVMGGLPFDHYSFLLVGDPAGGGGLEHHDSTGMIIDPWVFARDAGYASMQRLMAHEFFHLWNVKRIHDTRLGPFDYAHETYTDLLWFHEGLTETMETRALLRAGLISPQQYLDQLAGAWTGYLRKPGRNYAPIAELSREAWIKSYKPEANHGETTISYYEKGNLIGVCLDLSLRLRGRANHTGASLDGLFRRLWAQRDPATGQAAITIDDIVAAASAEAGEDMRWFFERYVYGTQELPLPKLLEQAGFVVEVGEAGGREAVWSGIGGHASVRSIEPESPAAAAGLMLDDEIIAVDGVRVDGVREANERLMDLGVGVTAQLSLFRGERLETRALTTAATPHRRYGFARPDTDAGERELARLRELWLLEHLVR